MKTTTRFSVALVACAFLHQAALAVEAATPATSPAAAAAPVAPTALPAATPATAGGPTSPAAVDSAVPHANDGEEAAPSHANDDANFGDHQNSAFVEFVFMALRGSDLSFSQPRDGCGASSVPKGPQGTVSPNYAPGFRVGGELAFDCNQGIELSYTHWEAQTHANEVAPRGTVLQSELTLPGTTNCASNSMAASAGFGLQLREADLAYTRALCGDSKCYIVNWSAGARYAHLRQDLNTDFTILGDTSVDTRVNFDGVGPRVGLNGEAMIGHGMMIYARSSLSLLAGHIGASFTQNNTFAGNQGNITYRDDRIVPIADLELGFGWTSPKGHVHALLGYLVSAWFDTVTTPDFINAVQANNFSNSSGNLRDTLWFDALTARVEFRY